MKKRKLFRKGNIYEKFEGKAAVVVMEEAREGWKNC